MITTIPKISPINILLLTPKKSNIIYKSSINIFGTKYENIKYIIETATPTMYPLSKVF